MVIATETAQHKLFAAQNSSPSKEQRAGDVLVTLTRVLAWTSPVTRLTWAPALSHAAALLSGSPSEGPSSLGLLLEQSSEDPVPVGAGKTVLFTPPTPDLVSPHVRSECVPFPRNIPTAVTLLLLLSC